jgi:hypothetical protein
MLRTLMEIRIVEKLWKTIIVDKLSRWFKLADRQNL